MISLDLALKTF